MNNTVAQLYEKASLRSKIGIPTIFGLRSPVIQKTFRYKCATSVVERVVVR